MFFLQNIIIKKKTTLNVFHLRILIISRCSPFATNVQPLSHGGVFFCMAQWAYSNHPTDASYSSSLSVCTLQEPVFLFFCTAPTDARLTYIPLTRFKGGDGTVGAFPPKKRETKITFKYIYKIHLPLCRESSCLRCYPCVGAEYQHPASALSSAIFLPKSDAQIRR